MYPFRRVWPTLLSIIVLLLILVAPAIAQVAAAAPRDTFLHIPQAAWDEINALIVGLFIAIATLAWKWIDAHSPLKKTQSQQIARDAYTSLLTTAAKYGLTQLQSAEKKIGEIDIGNAAVAAAANMVIAQGPILAKQVGVDVTTPEGRAAIIRSVTARIGDMQTAPASPPASVPLPAEVALTGTGTAPKEEPGTMNVTRLP